MGYISMRCIECGKEANSSIFNVCPQCALENLAKVTEMNKNQNFDEQIQDWPEDKLNGDCESYNAMDVVESLDEPFEGYIDNVRITTSILSMDECLTTFTIGEENVPEEKEKTIWDGEWIKKIVSFFSKIKKINRALYLRHENGMTSIYIISTWVLLSLIVFMFLPTWSIGYILLSILLGIFAFIPLGIIIALVYGARDAYINIAYGLETLISSWKEEK